MKRLEILEDYFVKMHNRYGICKISFDRNELEVEDKCLRNMVFRSDDFNKEYDTLQEHCGKLFQHLKRGFRLKMKKGWNNDVYVIVE